jgi:hypothetical protein
VPGGRRPQPAHEYHPELKKLTNAADGGDTQTNSGAFKLAGAVTHKVRYSAVDTAGEARLTDR